MENLRHKDVFWAENRRSILIYIKFETYDFFIDTYWGIPEFCSDGSVKLPDGCVTSPEEEMQYLFNFDDVRPINDNLIRYYNNDDIFEMPEKQGYRSKYYVRLGAKPCPETIKEQLRQDLNILECKKHEVEDESNRRKICLQNLEAGLISEDELFCVPLLGE